MKFVCTLITVEDMNRSKAFYQNVLQQKIKYDFGENVQFESGIAIHLRSHFSKLIENKPVYGCSNNCELYFEVDDIESFSTYIQSHSILFIHPLREQPWRQRVIRFYDPDMNIIEIGESFKSLFDRLKREGLSIDKMSQVSGMSKDVIIDILHRNKVSQTTV